MATPITIKKRKMTLKPAGSASQDDVSASEDAGTDADDTLHEDVPPDFSAPPLHAPGPSYALFAILAIVAMLLFLALVVMQWMEWTDINTIFPRPIQTGEFAPPPT